MQQPLYELSHMFMGPDACYEAGETLLDPKSKCT